MEYRLFGWTVREHDLINRDGVVWRKVTVMPFSRIQHVSTGNGPVERWFGLMHLKCFSAGGASADVMVQGLTPDTAESLRRYILTRLEDGDVGEVIETSVSGNAEPEQDER
nr:PH domain-containing protein [Natronospira proteinivora]